MPGERRGERSGQKRRICLTGAPPPPKSPLALRASKKSRAIPPLPPKSEGRLPASPPASSRRCARPVPHAAGARPGHLS